jgi:uncharacterized protein DUF6624
MPNARSMIVVGIVAALGATPLAAQSAAGRCAPLDTTAKWYAKQRQWADDSKHTWSNDSLRTALIHAAGLDANPNAGAGALLGYEIAGTAPTAPQADAAAAITTLRALAQTRGSTWPTKSVVGARGVRAVWMLASQDSALARVALHRMMEAGPEESPPAAVAVLEDRLRIAGGRKQLYATQLVKSADGKLEPAPVEDPKHVDLRRDAAGLPPLAQAVCAASEK